MLYFIKKTLFRFLPEKLYLSVLHSGFYFLFWTGLLKSDAQFKFHYMVPFILEKDDHVVDLGANLGYFARNFARIAKKGRIYCIEPIPNFYALLKNKLYGFKNVELFHTALGDTNGSVTMVLPSSNGMIRTGLPHIITEEEKASDLNRVEVKLTHAGELFSSFEKIDYIKCDIEGYEWTVFQLIKDSIEKNQPTIQVEIGEENAANMIGLLTSLGYVHYGIADFKIIRDQLPQTEAGDFLFVHESKQERFEKKMKLLRKMA